LSLAEEAGCEFWTADQKLYNAVKDRMPFVKWLGDYGNAASLLTP
jgi:predicted nucleic acid-binding protein